MRNDMRTTQKLNLFVATVAIATAVYAGNEVENAFTVLSHAEQLESSLLGESGQQSKLSPMFAVLTQAEDQEQHFQRLASAAATNAGKAYGVVGLYRIQPDKALKRASALPANFKIPYTLFCISGEWDRDEFVQQLKEGDLLRAMFAVPGGVEPSRNLVSEASREEHKNKDLSLATTVEPKPERIRELINDEPLQQKVSHRLEGSDDSARPEEQAAFSGSRGSFVLFSWKDRGDYRFALVPVEKEAGFLKTFHPRRIGLHGLTNLKTALEQLSTGTAIVWEDDQIKGFTYPSIDHINQITAFARSRGLHIELNPVVIE
jgi:hypothetical protein